MSADLRVVPDDRALARRAAEWLVAKARAAVAARGACAVALAGGTTPRAAYEVLATSALARALPWGAIDWYFGDERAVPFDHPDSNYRLASETLFAGRPEALDRARRMPADAADADAAARAYSLLLPDPIDVLLLGLGEDGHTASLFPGQPAGDAPGSPDVLAVHGAPKPPPERVTLSVARLARARRVVFLVTGPDKRAAVAAWRRGGELPARLIAPAGEVEVLLDADADAK